MSAPGAVQWASSFDAAAGAARRARRSVLVHFTIPERPLCRRMAEETFADGVVQALLAAHFVPVRLDSDRERARFARLVGGQGALASSVVDEAEDVLSVQVGYAAPAPFAAFLARARDARVPIARARASARRRAKDPAAAWALATLYEEAGSPLRAEAELRRALALCGARPEGPTAVSVAIGAHERLARGFAVRGRNVDARPHLEAARALDPADRTGRGGRLLLTAAIVCAVERRMREARAQAEAALSASLPDGDRAHALFVLATAQHELADDGAALATLRRLLREHPGSTWAEPARTQIGHIERPVADHRH